MPLTEGSKVGPYVVAARIGAGGMGEVWRARDPRLGRDVAIKVLPDAAAPDRDRVARFHAEARAASLLSHPNVVTVYDVGQEDGRAWLAMELLEGATLRALMDGGRLPLRRALPIASQIADGLAATHAKGIVHRDLKPENVVVTDDGVVKILDFGLAKSSPLTAAGRDDTMSEGSLGTSPGAFLGTIGYMSPEQAAGEPADFRSDQFSYGTILYELVTGERAWKKATPAETLVAILREDPPAPAPGDPSLPLSLRRVIERCLAKDPRGRFDSTRDLAGAVRDLVESVSGLTPPPGPPGVPAPRLGSRRPFARVAAVVCGVAALGVLGVALRLRIWPGGAPIASLAVLPFENGTKDAESDYLSDGLTEGLIDRMSRLPALRVMARTTVFRFKGIPDPLEAGRKLDVGAVIIGTVSRREDRLDVAVEVVDVGSGARLWGKRYERPFADLVRVQAEIASDVSAGLRLRLAESEKRLLARRGTESSEAYDLYLKGRHSAIQETEEGYREAIRLFQRAAEKDPGFAEAHLWAADTYGSMATDGYAPPSEAWSRSDEGARKALALDPDLSDARAALASRRAFFDWDLAGAEREFRELFDAARPPVWHLRAFALLLWARGKTEEAVFQTERARRMDPGNLLFTISSGDYRAQAGQFAEAVGFYRAAREAEPDDPRPLFGLASVFRMRGETDKAIETLRKAYELSWEDEGVRALASARTAEDYDAAQVSVSRLRLAEMEALARVRYVSPLDLARLQALVGEKERALASLEKAVAERSGGLIFLNVDRAWDGIRSDARFASVVKRVGFGS